MPRILIVDDEHVVAETLRLIFSNRGFAARAVHSAGEAMHAAGEFDPELMLCDIDMPETDGVDLIAAMDAHKPACRIMVLTGAYASIQRVVERALELHRRVPVFAKPCPPDDLLRAADDLLLATA